MDEALGQLRSTPEYAAAFDLELWKAEEKRKFLADLEGHKAEVSEGLRKEFAALDATRVAEVEAAKEELCTMVQGLETSARALEKRYQALQEKEESFETRRLDIARQHEQYLHESDARMRRLAEESRLQVQVAQSQVAERDSMIHLLNERCSAIQREYESLQSLQTDMQSRESNDAVNLRGANAKIEELSRALRATHADTKTLLAERDQARQNAIELAEGCTHYKKQLQELAVQHNELLAHVQKAEATRLLGERNRLEQERRRAMKGGRGSQQLERVWAHETLLPSNTRNTSRTNDNGVKDFLTVVEALAKKQKKKKSKRASSAQRIGAQGTGDASPAVGRGQPRTNSVPPSRSPVTPADVDSVVPASTAGAPYAELSLVSLSSMSNDGDVAAGDGLPELDFDLAERGRLVGMDPKPASFTSLPGLSDEHTEDKATRRRPMANPRPDAPQRPAPPPMDLDDMLDHIQRLQRNRERLISTGVYDANDDIIQDMDNKIATYRALLEDS